MEQKGNKLKRSINNLDQGDSVIKRLKRTKDHHLQDISLESSDEIIEKLTSVVDPLRENEVDVTYLSLKKTCGEESPSNNQSYQCGVCNRKFLKMSNLMDHMNIHLGYKCRYCRETLITSTPVSDHIVLNEEAACLLKKWKEMEKHRCFVYINEVNFDYSHVP